MKPKEQNGVQGFEILTKKHDPMIIEDVYISYTIVMSFLIEGKSYFFRIDPLVKISSKHGGG